MYQVNRFFLKHNLVKQIFRNIHRPSVKVLYPLKSRGLLKVSGDDASVFLQGLITNDMNHFEDGATSIYAMFLNNKGRVLYDTLIHKWEGRDSFILECDKSIYTSLQKHLKVYKLKRNVEIIDMNEDLKLFVLLSPTEIGNSSPTIVNKVNIYKDPRLTALGHRVITPNGDEAKIAKSFGENAVVACDETGYKYLRYKLGVSEGAEDLPPGTCFPLEANCDYLHGVSFHKGCYIGQELTARVHHTGVVRKRIMPLRFIDVVEDEIKKDSVINAEDTKKSNVGKIKTFFNGYALGLVRIKEALEATTLKIDKYTVEIIKPLWWPKEATKEKMATKVE